MIERTRSRAATVTVRYFAGAMAAAGVAEEQIAATTVDELLATIACTHGPRMGAVLQVASLLVDGRSATRERTCSLLGVETVDILPPFAGG